MLAPENQPVMGSNRYLPLVAGWILGVFLAKGVVAEARSIDSGETKTHNGGVEYVTSLNPTNGLGLWIWSSKTMDRQTCRFWRGFEVPEAGMVVRGLLRMTADNGYTVFLDGRQVGKGSYWKTVNQYDLTWLLTPGHHVLAVEGFNDLDLAGVILGLHMSFSDGSVIEIGSDKSWRVVEDDEPGWQTRRRAPNRWPAATVIGPWWVEERWRIPLVISAAPPELPVQLHFWQAGWFQVATLSMCGLGVLICLRLMAQLALQGKAQRLLQLERARIARDIHDDLGAGLTKLVLLGEVLQNGIKSDDGTRAQVGQLCERARDLSKAMDEVVWAINSRRDTLVDFSSYMCKYAQAFFSSGPIRCRLDVEPELPTTEFDLPIRRNLFLAVKEALNNAAKHSHATEVFLRIHRRGEGLLVVVDDNGRGFDRSEAGQERNGLTNMEQRMKEVGGVCVVKGQLGAGCRVQFELPRLRAQRRSWWHNLRAGWPFRFRREGVAPGNIPGVKAVRTQHS